MKRWQRYRQLLTRLVLALSMVGLALAAFRFGVQPLLESWLESHPGALTWMRRAGTLAFGLAGYWAYVRFIEHRRMTEWSFRLSAIGLGALSGSLLIAGPIALLFALGNYQLVSFRGYQSVLPTLGLIVAVATLEELIFRGIVFRLLEDCLGTTRALLLQSLLFAALHLANGGAPLMILLAVTLLGLFWTAVFLVSRNLWVCSVNHGTWNATIALSGVPLSGTPDWQASAPLETVYQGPDLLTGGAFGPETSIIAITLLSCITGGLLYWAWRHQHFVNKPAAMPPLVPVGATS